MAHELPASADLKSAWSLRTAMAVQFAAGGAVIPFIAILFRDRGLDYGQISRILMTASGMLLVFPVFWGMLADRFIPLNRLFVIINLVAVAALFIVAQTGNYFTLLIGYVAYSAAISSTFNLINALGFHHLSNPRVQFSRLRAWGSVGWIVPFLPISLWMVIRPGDGLNFTLYFGAGFCLLMGGVALFLPHTPPGAWHDESQPRQPGAYLPAVRRLVHTREYMVILITMFLMSGSFALVTFYSPPFLEGLGVPRPWIGPAQAIGVIFEVVLFQYQPRLLSRWNFTGTILVGCLALFVRNLMFALLDNVWLLCFSYLLAGATIVLYHMSISVLVNMMAAIEVRATAQTMLSICSQGLGPMFANWLAGNLAVAYGDNLRPVFGFAAFLAFLAFLLIAVDGRRLNLAGQSGSSSALS